MGIKNYIFERLKITAKSKTNEDYKKEHEIENFKKFYKGIPEDIQDKIIKQYLYGNPFEDAENADLICTPFELLFLLAALLVDDGAPYNYYNSIGFKPYKRHGYKNNPYDWSWYDVEVDNYDDILEYLQDKWIPNHIKEWQEIYSLCSKYKNILSIDNIWECYQHVFDS